MAVFMAKNLIRLNFVLITNEAGMRKHELLLLKLTTIFGHPFDFTTIFTLYSHFEQGCTFFTARLFLSR